MTLPDSDRIRVALAAADLRAVLEAAAPLLVPAALVPAAVAALRASRGAAALGDGVAAPHGELAGIDAPRCALVTLAAPIDVGALDGQPADLFFVLLAPPHDPGAHLHALAHVARVAASPLLRRGLRQATADEAAALLRAAEARLAPAPAAPRAGAADGALAVLVVDGERAAEHLLVALIDAGLHDATVLDARTAQEAVAWAVPIFATFRDMLGDPGGRHVVLVEVAGDAASALRSAVEATRAQPGVRVRAALLPLLEALPGAP